MTKFALEQNLGTNVYNADFTKLTSEHIIQICYFELLRIIGEGRAVIEMKIGKGGHRY